MADEMAARQRAEQDRQAEIKRREEVLEQRRLEEDKKVCCAVEEVTLYIFLYFETFF